MSHRLTDRRSRWLITQQRLRIVSTNKGGKLSVSTHQKGVGAGLQGVAMCSAEAHETTKRRPAIVITVVHADEDIGGVLHARGKQRFINIRERIRVAMSGSSLKPRRVSLGSIRERS